MGYPASGRVMIHASDVNRPEPWPDLAQLAKPTRYSSDLTDEARKRIVPLIPKPAARGWRREVECQEVINVVQYLGR